MIYIEVRTPHVAAAIFRTLADVLAEPSTQEPPPPEHCPSCLHLSRHHSPTACQVDIKQTAIGEPVKCPCTRGG